MRNIDLIEIIEQSSPEEYILPKSFDNIIFKDGVAFFTDKTERKEMTPKNTPRPAFYMWEYLEIVNMFLNYSLNINHILKKHPDLVELIRETRNKFYKARLIALNYKQFYEYEKVDDAAIDSLKKYFYMIHFPFLFFYADEQYRSMFYGDFFVKIINDRIRDLDIDNMGYIYVYDQGLRELEDRVFSNCINYDELYSYFSAVFLEDISTRESDLVPEIFNLQNELKEKKHQLNKNYDLKRALDKKVEKIKEKYNNDKQELEEIDNKSKVFNECMSFICGKDVKEENLGALACEMIEEYLVCLKKISR